MNTLLRILRSRAGVSIVEYAILLGLVVAILTGVASAFGAGVSRTFASLHLGTEPGVTVTTAPIEPLDKRTP